MNKIFCIYYDIVNFFVSEVQRSMTGNPKDSSCVFPSLKAYIEKMRRDAFAMVVFDLKESKIINLERQ